MVLMEDLLEHRDTLQELGWNEYDVSAMSGIEAALLMNIIELYEENAKLKQALGKLSE